MTASSTPPVGGQVPDDTRAWRDALAEALANHYGDWIRAPYDIENWRSDAAALLPTVARIVAQELRKLADEMEAGRG